MKRLVNQPTKRPTRKIWAVIIAAAIVGAARSVLDALFPEMKLGPQIEAIRPFIESGLIAAAGYFARDSA